MSSGDSLVPVSDLSGAHDELTSSVAARRELGPEYDSALVEGFLSRVERAIDERVDRRLHGPPAATVPPQPVHVDGRQRSRALPVVSLALAIPITAIAGSDFHGANGVVVAVVSWAGIVAVNVAHALGRSRQGQTR